MNKYFSIKLLSRFLIVLSLVTLSSFALETTYSVSSAEYQSQIVDLVNQERQKIALTPLISDKELQNAAVTRNNEITVLFDHNRPDGTSWSTVSDKAQGENLAAGQKTPEEVVKAWMNSEGHKKNILNPNFTTIGVSHVKTNYKHKNYWVQVFGGIKQKKILLKKINGLKAITGKNKIKLKWNLQTSTHANGYQIFRYDSKTKKYKFLVTIKSTKKNSFVNTGLKSGITYKYKLRSYKTVNNKNYYTPAVKINTKTLKK